MKYLNGENGEAWPFCLALGAIVFHKRIPILKKFTSKKARFLFALLFSFIASIHPISKFHQNYKEMNKIYLLHK
jgi:hypothetical protein